MSLIELRGKSNDQELCKLFQTVVRNLSEENSLLKN